MNKSYNINKFMSQLYLSVNELPYADYFNIGICYSADTHFTLIEYLNSKPGDKIVHLEFLWGLPLILKNMPFFKYEFIILKGKDLKYYAELREKLINNI